MRRPRWRRHHGSRRMGTWAGPPHPLPGGGVRDGDCWRDLVPTRALTEPTEQLPVAAPLLDRKSVV